MIKVLNPGTAVSIVELNKRAAESELRLKRLYDAIEGVPPIWTIRGP